MEAHLFRLFAQAAAPFFRDAGIEKIQEPEPGLLTMNLRGPGWKKQLNWSFSRQLPFCFLSDSRLAAGKSPSASIMRLRKYFSGRRIASAVFQFCQRRLWLLASGRPDSSPQKTVPWLCLDLVKGPSLHFLEAEEAPREDNPRWPKPEELAEACQNWRDWPVLTPPLRKYLADLEEPDRWALMEDLRPACGALFLYQTDKVARISAWPLALREGESCQELFREDWLKGFERAGNDLVLRKLHESGQDRLLAPLRKKRERKLRILQKLEEDEKRLRSMAARGEDGEILRAQLWRYDGGSHLSGIETGDRMIPLNEKYSLLENMERFFHESKRGKRGLEALSQRKAALLEEISSLEKADGGELAERTEKEPEAPVSRISALRMNLPKDVQGLLSSDGHILLRGKSAKGNRTVLRLAQPHDLWGHVETGQGAHVLIRRKFPGEEISGETFAEAASLAAVKSWFKDAGSCSVMFAEARHVKPAKNGPPGKVIIDKMFRTGLFQIDSEIEAKLAKRER